jgi:acyl-CoA dehydrogenase
MMEPSAARSRLTRHVFSEAIDTCPLGHLEAVFDELCTVAPLEKRVSDAVKEGKLKSLTLLQQIVEAESLGVLTHDEAMQLQHAEQGRQRVIAVDDFDDSELRRPSKAMHIKKQSTVVI